MKSKFVFVDCDTQKGYVEHFGSRAIPDCPEIRENLMILAHLGSEKGIPIICLMDSRLADSDKVQDMVAESGQKFFYHSGEIGGEEIDEFIAQVEPKYVFIYGVPLGGTVTQAALYFVKFDAQIWVVSDAVKARDASLESEILLKLKEKGVRMALTHNMSTFLNL